MEDAPEDQDAWVGRLRPGLESILTIRDRITAEAHDFAATRDIAQAPVEVELGLVSEVLSSNLDDLILVRPVVTGNASELRVSVSYDPVGYRRIAEAAKNRVLTRV